MLVSLTFTRHRCDAYAWLGPQVLRFMCATPLAGNVVAVQLLRGAGEPAVSLALCEVQVGAAREWWRRPVPQRTCPTA